MMQDDRLNEMLQKLTEVTGRDAAASFSEFVKKQKAKPKEIDFQDPKICDAVGCNTKTSKQCKSCKCRMYCSRECQKVAWPSHKEECKMFKRCVQTSQINASMADTRGDKVMMGTCTTKNHGRHFYAMEQFAFMGDGSKRKVPIASTSNVSLEGITSCIFDAILFPEFDTDCQGRRRPYYVEIFSDTFEDKALVTAIATLCVRLEIHIKSWNEPASAAFCSHWFFVQKGYLEDLSDKLFLSLYGAERLHPLPPNGMARKEVGSVAKESKKMAPRLDPKEYPKLKKVKKLPFSETELCVVCREAILYILITGPGGAGGYRLLLSQPVQLQKRTGRPYPEDVFLCIYQVLVEDTKTRPIMIVVGQPSVCALADVGIYEKTLDYVACKDGMALAAKDTLEHVIDLIVNKGMQH